MSTLCRSFRFLLRAKLRAPIFYAALAAALLSAVIPLATAPSLTLSAAVCDMDHTGLSRSLVSDAMAIPTLRLQECDGERLDDALASLRSGGTEAVFVIDRGYQSLLNAGKYKNAVRLYLSPYSTSARTLSDSVAALVMRQWLKLQAQDKAVEAMGADAGDEVVRRMASGSVPIITLNTAGEKADVTDAKPASRKAENALIILAGISCFLILCFPETGGQDADATVDRMISMGRQPYACAFACTLTHAVPPALAAVVPAVAFIMAFGVQGLYGIPLFLLYLLACAGAAALLDTLVRGVSIRLTLGLILSIVNAVLLFPRGLAQMTGPARGLFAGYWLSGAIHGGIVVGLIALLAYAIVAIAAGRVLAEWQLGRR